jgi:hypothetical protein
MGGVNIMDQKSDADQGTDNKKSERKSTQPTTNIRHPTTNTNELPTETPDNQNRHSTTNSQHIHRWPTMSIGKFLFEYVK